MGIRMGILTKPAGWAAEKAAARQTRHLVRGAALLGNFSRSREGVPEIWRRIRKLPNI